MEFDRMKSSFCFLCRRKVRINLFKIPTRNDLRSRWVKHLGRDDFPVKAKVCRIHFENDCFSGRALKNQRLSLGALPTKYLDGNPEEVNAIHRLTPAYRRKKKKPGEKKKDGEAPSSSNKSAGPSFIQMSPCKTKMMLNCLYCKEKFIMTSWRKFINHLRVIHENDLCELQVTIIANKLEEMNKASEAASTAKNQGELAVTKIKSEPEPIAFVDPSRIDESLDIKKEPGDMDDDDLDIKEDLDSEDEISELEFDEPAQKDDSDDVPIYKHNRKTFAMDHTHKELVVGFLNLYKDYPILWRYRSLSTAEEYDVALKEFSNRLKHDVRISLNTFNLRRAIENMKLWYLRKLDSDWENGEPKFKKYMELLIEMVPAREEPEYKCDHCRGVEFYTEDMLQNHKFHEHNIGSLPFSCRICDRSFITISRRKAHEFKDHAHEMPKKKTLQCTTCEKWFKFEKEFKNHPNCLPLSNNTCVQCNKQFNSSGVLKRHLLHVHALVPHKHKCSACPKTFAAEYMLKTHYKRCHEKARDVMCEHCGKGFTTNSYLKTHIEFMHQDHSIYYACFCGKDCMTIAIFRFHIRKHHKGYKFGNLSQYERNMDLTVKIPTFMCDICHELCKNDIYVKFHKRTVHGIGGTGRPIQPNNNASAKQFGMGSSDEIDLTKEDTLNSVNSFAEDEVPPNYGVLSKQLWQYRLQNL